MSRLKEMPPGDLPRERLERVGAESLSNAELIAILLRTGMKGTHVLQLAQEMLNKYSSLAAISRCSVKELSRIKGVGPAKAVQLAAAFALGHRLPRENVVSEQFDNPETIYAVLGGEMRALTYESLRVVLLNTKLHLIRIEEVSKGSINETVANIPSIVKPALVSDAYAFILVHNHPSGDPQPSQADHRFTQRLLEAAHLLQLRFLDHIICGAPRPGQPGYHSFREAGVL